MVGLLSQDPFANLSSLETMEASMGISAKDFNLDAAAFFDSANGFAGDSESVNSGGANADGLGRIQDKQLAIKEKEKKQDDAKELMEFGFSQRQALIQQVTYSDGYFHIGDMKIAEEDLREVASEKRKELKGKPEEYKDKYGMSGTQLAAMDELLKIIQDPNSTPDQVAEAMEKAQEINLEFTQEEILVEAESRTNASEYSAAEEYKSFAQEALLDEQSDKPELAADRSTLETADNFIKVEGANANLSQFSL